MELPPRGLSLWYNGVTMSDLNVYASKIYSEHPLAIWALDANVGETTTFPQYSTDVYPASVDQCKRRACRWPMDQASQSN